MGLPYVKGYQPYCNYQNLLADAVCDFLDARPGFLEPLADGPVARPTKPTDFDRIDRSRVVEEPPERIVLPAETAKPWLSRRARRIDFAQRDAANRELGRLGEEFAVWFEQQRLRATGRDDLAVRVEWVSRDVGDGLGFDVLSFDEGDDSEKLIEVKATGLGKYFPFLVTATEVRCSEDVGPRFHLFRVFDLARSPKLFVLRGSLRQTCGLVPALYQVRFGEGA
jgi:hypothetical protein